MSSAISDFSILHAELVMDDHFSQNISAWEITQKPDEQAFIKDGHYWMENKTVSRWMYYQHQFPLKSDADFLIDTEIELLNACDTGNFGLIWGFNSKVDFLNRFTVSAGGTHAAVLNFQKDHHRVFHRFRAEISPYSADTVRLSILKLRSYFHFLVNGQLAYTCHQHHLVQNGNGFGYYVEPGLFIRSRYMRVKRLLVKPSGSSPHLAALLD